MMMLQRSTNARARIPNWPGATITDLPNIRETLKISRDLEDHNFRSLLNSAAVRNVPALRSVVDAFAVLANRSSTREQRANAVAKLSAAYGSSEVASLLDALRKIASSGLSDMSGLDWSKISRRAASVRKELASNPLSLRLYNAIQAFMTGGVATGREILDLASAITAAPAAEVAKALQNVKFWATLVMRQELVAPYEGMSQERLSELLAKGRIPAAVLQAAKDLTAQGMWAAGLFEVNVARKLVQIRKDEAVVAQFLARKKWARYSDVSRHSWSDVPAETQAAVKRLIEARRGVDVSWGGGTTKFFFKVSDGAGALGDLYLALTVDGDAYLADLKDKANQLVTALRLLTSLLSSPPSAGTDSGSFAKNATEYADKLRNQLAVVFGDGVREGALKEFNDSLAAASEYGISKKGLDNQLKIAFPDDIDGDGRVKNTVAGFYAEISGLVAGRSGLLDVALEYIRNVQNDYGATKDKEAKARTAQILNLVFGIASAGVGIAAGALKFSTSVADFSRSGSGLRKALGDSFSVVGAALGASPTISSAIDAFKAVKSTVNLAKEDSRLAASIRIIADKLDQLNGAFLDLYRTLGPDLPKKQIGNFSEDIELEDPGFAGPDREGYLVTWWEKKQSDSGSYWLLYGLPYS